MSSSKSRPDAPEAAAAATAPATTPQQSSQSKGSLTAEPQGYFEQPRFKGPKWSTAVTPHEPHVMAATDSPATAAAAGATTGRELLRRMSLAGTRRQTLEKFNDDPLSVYPSLSLSGNIITAAFAMPFSFTYKGGEQPWELNARRGTSAIFDSFGFLASDKTHWNHTLVAWTGEIKVDPKLATVSDSPLTGSQARVKASAPIPVDADAPSPSKAGIFINKEDRGKLEKKIRHGKYGHAVPVWMEGEDEDLIHADQARWRRYAEHELYSLFHYKQHESTEAMEERKWWADYVRLNLAFADRIMEIYKPGDIVCIHDYHLLLLPAMLRKKMTNIYIGFFLHIPFPSSEFVRCSSRRKELLTGMLGSNMIGFQSYGYSRHFASSCKRILDFDSDGASVEANGREIPYEVFPIGIDVPSVEESAFGDPQIAEKMKAIRALYAGKKIIVGRDRLDSVRGIVQKLEGFEMFLERFPEWRQKVVLIQVTSSSSTESVSEVKIQNKVSDLVARINGRYGTLSFSPVQHYPQYLPKQEYNALLRLADVGLITTVRDGMNTTALEYVICQKDNHGPLIISEFSGTASSLSQALQINPWDTLGVAHSIKQALEMSSEEKKSRHDSLYKHITSNTVQDWTSHFLKRLLTNLSSNRESQATPLLDREKLLATYKAAKKRLFMFDYDGTLTPIVRDPNAAIPTDRILRNLKALASDSRNAVWIISGRDQNFLNQWMGDISELGLSAEHGSFIRPPGNDEWENLAEKLDMGWQKEVLDIFQYYTEKTQGSFIERKRCALTWHYRRADPDHGATQARECQRHLENTVGKKWDVEVMAGKANLEVRPTFINKGEISKRLVEQYGDDPPQFVFCLGDDFTDEDMFRALRHTTLPADHVFATTVGASTKMTLAGWHVLEPADVISAISMLNGMAESRSFSTHAMPEPAKGESSL